MNTDIMTTDLIVKAVDVVGNDPGIDLGGGVEAARMARDNPVGTIEVIKGECKDEVDIESKTYGKERKVLFTEDKDKKSKEGVGKKQ